MSYSFGENLKVTVFGQSHSEEIGVVIDGLPAGVKIDNDAVECFLKRRSGKKELSTARREADEVNYVSGIFNGKTCGAPLTAIIKNSDIKSKDYSNLINVPRPSHADYTANIKYNGNYDYRGGGQFSGRLTAPLCIAGAVVSPLLKEKNIYVYARIKSIHGIKDTDLDYVNVNEKDFETRDEFFPVLNKDIKEEMQREILKAKDNCDSVGGTIECFIFNMPCGAGEPNFQSIESKISSLMFSVPAVKGIEFGNGFKCANLYGSENNDGYVIDNGKIKTITNNGGGITGGISNGMPIVFTVAIKPTPSIFKEQNSVNLEKMQNEKLIINGRHDPCIVPRAVPVIESMAILAVYDLLRNKNQRI